MKRRKNHCDCHLIALISIAFGCGIFLAMFCSLKLVVILAALFLILLGFLSSC